MMPGSVVRSFADRGIKRSPVIESDRFGPIIKVAQDDPDSPKGTRVLNELQKGQGLLNSFVRFCLRWRRGILRQSRSVWAASGVKIADHHVIQLNIVKA